MEDDDDKAVEMEDSVSQDDDIIETNTEQDLEDDDDKAVEMEDSVSQDDDIIETNTEQDLEDDDDKAVEMEDSVSQDDDIIETNTEQDLEDDDDKMEDSVSQDDDIIETNTEQDLDDDDILEREHIGIQEDENSIDFLWNSLEDKELEIGILQMEIEQLKQNIGSLELTNHILKYTIQNQLAKSKMSVVNVVKDLANSRFGVHMINGDDKKTCFYTGLPTYKVFIGLYDLLKSLPSVQKSSVDDFFLVLIKPRLALPNEDLGYRFSLDPSHVSRIFHKWLYVLSTELKCLIAWPDEVKLHENMPSSFRKHFSNTRCIIDCFEIFIERPTYFEARALTYSNYKKHNTAKVLIAVTPTGSVCFISKAWGGRV